jgi:hypothetical protein
MLRMLSTILLALDATALYLSTLVGPAPVGSPGGLVPSVSEIMTFDTVSENVTQSYGWLSTDASVRTSCSLSTSPLEAPLTGVGDTLDLYTVCSDRSSSSILSKTSLLGSNTYTPLGSTTIFQNTTVSRLATDNGTNFYILSRIEGGNSTVWLVSSGTNAVVVSDTRDDGWQLQHLTVLGGQLFGIGNQLGNLQRTLVSWGRVLPIARQPPQRYPGLSGNLGPTLSTFAFSDPNTLWIVSGGQLLLYIYNKQTFAWTVGGYYMFNTTFTVPSAILMGSRPPVVKFHGVSATQLMEFTFPIPTAGGTSTSALITKVLRSSERGKSFRGLSISNWVLPSPTTTPTLSSSSTASVSSTATASATMTSTATVTATSTASATMTSMATVIATSTASATMTSMATVTATSTASTTQISVLGLSMTSSTTHIATPILPSLSSSSTPSHSPTPSSTPSPTPSRSNGTSPEPPAAAATGNALTDGEKIGLGFGLTGLVGLLVGCVTLYGCYKSGKLFTLFLKKPRTSYPTHTHPSSGPARSIPRSLAPVQLNINPAHIAKLNETRMSMRIAEEQTQVTEGGGFTVKTIKRTYAPLRVEVGGTSSRTLSPLTNRMGTSV